MIVRCPECGHILDPPVNPLGASHLLAFRLPAHRVAMTLDTCDVSGRIMIECYGCADLLTAASSKVSVDGEFFCGRCATREVLL